MLTALRLALRVSVAGLALGVGFLAAPREAFGQG